MLYYGPTLIQEIGLKGDTVSLVVSGGIGIVQFIAVLPAIVYIDRVGRKALLRGSYPCFCVPSLGKTFFSLLDYDRGHNSASGLTLM